MARTAEEDPGAPFMNDSTKYVVSSTLEVGTLENSQISAPTALMLSAGSKVKLTAASM